MTQTQSKAQMVARRALRLSPVIIVTAIVGAALMAWTAYSTAPEFTWRADAAIRVVNHVASPAYPQPGTAVAIAGQPAIREEAVAQAGVDERKVGPVSAAVDSKDPAVVHLVVAAADSETALEVARELRSAVISATLEAVAPQIDFTIATRDAYQETAQQMSQIADETQARLAADPGNTDLQTLHVTAMSQARSMKESARNASFQLDLWTKGVGVFGEPSSEPVDTRSEVIVAGIQGAVLGAIIGFLLVAAVAAYQVWANPAPLAPPGE